MEEDQNLDDSAMFSQANWLEEREKLARQLEDTFHDENFDPQELNLDDLEGDSEVKPTASSRKAAH